MAKKQVNPTRMELTAMKRKLITAIRGHKLLKDKRDELMRQFLALVKENKALREEVEEGLLRSASNFALARAGISSQILDTGLLISGQQIGLEVGRKNIMGVLTPSFSFKMRSMDKSSIYSYGLSFTTEDLDIAAKSMSDMLPSLLRLAEVEKSCELMAAEIEKTRRRVNALEYTMIPEMQETIKYITMKLDENERANQIRLMKVKDMMLEQAHHYEERASGENADLALE
ncbi:MAG: V-type ATP synthase subunit D [Clostridiales bacterium]|jgi:V/A-type H+-transporting ATPase subunit D|nr:V-type ATP synthase subunit D [Clostridiales bacterium]